LNKYTSYRVNYNDGQYEIAVLRRYSDFLWLYERLHQDRPGSIVPAIPEKQPVGRFNAAFVEDRRIQLEKFVRRVAVHPELQDCHCLQTFLRADDVSFQAAKQIKSEMSAHQAALANSMMGHSTAGSFMHGGANTSSPAKKDTTGLKRWFAEAKTSMTGELVKSPDDDLFDEIQRYVHGLDVQMKSVTMQATSLTRKSKEVANGLFEFGLAFHLLGQSEADALGTALTTVSAAADRLSVIAAEQAAAELKTLEEPLQEYLKQIYAVKLALAKRHEKLLTYSTCLSDLESKQHSLHKLRSQLGSEAKAYQTEISMHKAQEQADHARDDFAATSQRVLREVDRFKREKTDEMRKTVLQYIQLQVEYNKQMESIWSNLIPELERVPLDTTIQAGPNAAVAARTATTPLPPNMVVGPDASSSMMMFGGGSTGTVVAPGAVVMDHHHGGVGGGGLNINLQYRDPPPPGGF
jgi:sorting nexin-1/2